jgi:hypothetical protein
MSDRDPTHPFPRRLTWPRASSWAPQSTTVFDEPPPRARLARGSTAPWPRPDEPRAAREARATTPTDDADTTAPVPRLVALIEPEPSIPVRLDPSPPRAASRPTRDVDDDADATARVIHSRAPHGAILTLCVLAIAAALLALMLRG